MRDAGMWLLLNFEAPFGVVLLVDSKEKRKAITRFEEYFVYKADPKHYYCNNTYESKPRQNEARGVCCSNAYSLETAIGTELNRSFVQKNKRQ